MCESSIIFPCVRRPSICPPRYLLLNHRAEFNQTCCITFPHCKGVREHHYFSVRPSSVNLSATLSPPKPPGGVQPNLQHHFPSLQECARPSICPPRYLLLNHRAEFNQTCCITSPHCKGVREHHSFSVRPSSVHLSATLSPPKPPGGVQPNLLHHFPSLQGCARASLFFRASVVRPSVRHAISS